MSKEVFIKEIENGFIISRNGKEDYYCKDVEELSNELLFIFEGRSLNFGGDHYGCVKVFKKSEESYTSPKDVEPH